MGKATQVFTLVVTDGDSDADDVPRTDGNNYELLWFALSIFSLNFIGIVLITKRKRTEMNKL
ncbi:MAG: hypothetical protein LBC71_06115 [Oscillospiraceae bacterium]|nr:hypothetical protein [Oscillospiraceae bacterium]